VNASLRVFENPFGTQAVLGFFDFIGYTKDGNVEKFKCRRSVETKNGRVAMHVCMGYIVPEYFKFIGMLAPGAGLKFEDVLKDTASHQESLNSEIVNGRLVMMAITTEQSRPRDNYEKLSSYIKSGVFLLKYSNQRPSKPATTQWMARCSA